MESCLSMKMREIKYEKDHNVEEDTVQGTVVCVSGVEVLKELNEMVTGESPVPSEVSLELIAASGGVGTQVTT